MLSAIILSSVAFEQLLAHKQLKNYRLANPYPCVHGISSLFFLKSKS